MITQHVAVGLIWRGEELLVGWNNKLQRCSFPMGKQEGTEPIGITLIRELQEELNITPKVFNLIEVYNFLIDGKNIIAHLHLVKRYQGELRNNEPHKCEWLEWLTIPELKQRTDLDIILTKWLDSK